MRGSGYDAKIWHGIGLWIKNCSWRSSSVCGLHWLSWSFKRRGRRCISGGLICLAIMILRESAAINNQMTRLLAVL